MKRLMKVLALAFAATLTMSMTAFADDSNELSLTHRHLTNANAMVVAEYPTIDGMDELNAKISADMRSLTRLFSERQDDFFMFSIDTEITYTGDVATITITPNLPAPFNVIANATVYYVNMADLTELTPAEAEEMIAAAPVVTEEDAVEEDAAEEYVTEEYVTEEYTTEEYAVEANVAYVNLRASVEALGITPVWDSEFQAAVLFIDDLYLGSLFVGDNLFYQYFTDDDFYVSEFALAVYNNNGTLQVGEDFIAALADVVEQLNNVTE